jgi:type VI secretion system protein ImpL
MMNFLSDNTAIVTLLALTLLVLLLLGVVVWAAMKGAGQADKAAAPKERRISTDSLRQSFRVAVELIEANLAARAERYNLNWTLVLNEGTQGRELPLVQSGVPLTASGQGISWNFFDNGVAIQLQTSYLGSPDPADGGSNSTWDSFLGLCRSYRPDRPFDGIVLALPASLFLDGDSHDPLDVVARAKAVHRRLWLAQNRLALRFPIYIAISDCETIPGFARFAAALPEPLRRSMLGWSSPYELSAPFQAQWIDNAMNDVVRSLSDAGAELCALEPAGADSSDYFLLPAQVERLRAGLKLFADELMRPSAYHEPFLLRGIYLTGDCSDAAVLAGAMAKAEPAPRLVGEDGLPPDALPPDALPATLAPGALEALDAAADEGAILAPGHAGHSSAVPAFLRDVFERKIFAETGLVRSASSQRLRRPAVNRALRWGAVAVPAVWVLGLGFGAVRLDTMSDQMVGYLERLERDTGGTLQAGLGRAADPAKARQRAIDALVAIERMDAAHMGSVFMPGSWPWFDGLHERLQRRMEKGFAENAFDPLRRAAYARVSQLTGVPVDPVSGSLIVGAQCTLPLNWAQNTQGGAAALNIEDLPEFGATLQYLAQLEQTEQLLAAMLRLKSPRSGPASGDDLALVVHMLLGVDLTGNPARTAALFRQVAQTVPSLSAEPLQEAAACSYHLAMRATLRRLFAENGLLASEQQIAENVRVLLDAGPRPADPVAALQAWQQLRTGLRAQERYMAGGKGAWMRGTALAPGPAWDNMLQRTEQLALLGKGPADAARKDANAGFLEFQGAWEAALASDRLIEGMGSGITWSDSNHAWAFADDRKALLDGLMGLLGQPYMKFNALARFAEVPSGATVSWDPARLDQALALADARKRFQAELMPKFPAPLQSSAAAVADAGLVQTARDLLAQSYFVSAREMQAPQTEAGRGRALRVRGWLEDIGAGAAAEELNGVLVKDALSRLQMLDETMARAQVFVPRDRAFRNWMGEKAPLLDAFGAADAAGLNGYVAQQQSFVEAIGKDAEALLVQVGGAQAGNPLVARWQATVADLQRYRLKSPTSSLVALESFVLGGAADIDSGNCLDKLSARAAQRRGADLFAERMQMLQAGLYTRCRELSQSGFDDAWNRFATAFNRDLSNRSPFRTVSFDASAKGERAPAADVEEVGNVLKLFERVPAAAQGGGRDAARPSAPVNLKKVDEQMQAVRDLLGPLFPSEDGQAAGLDVAVDFRANQGGEVDGNKIIEWTLSVGGQALRQRDPARPLRWEAGMPVALTLRLAQDGPTVPKADPAQPGMTVDGRTVSYRFDDPWALLSFIAAHRDGDSGARAQLLRFEFPTNQLAEGGRVQLRDARAKVFVRLTLSAPGKRTPLAWPSAFPVKVPTW